MPKKQQLTLKKMEAKVEALENDISEMRSSLTAVETAVRDMPGTLIAMLERALGKSVPTGNQSFQFRGTPEPEVDDGDRSIRAGSS
jgi:hypothetical protein